MTYHNCFCTETLNKSTESFMTLALQSFIDDVIRFAIVCPATLGLLMLAPAIECFAAAGGSFIGDARRTDESGLFRLAVSTMFSQVRELGAALHLPISAAKSATVVRRAESFFFMAVLSSSGDR